MTDLDATEQRLLALLEPYREGLVEGTIYGMPSLAWPGAAKQDYLVAWKQASRQVSLYLLPVLAHPDVLEAAGEGVRAAQTGKVTFGFREVDEELAGQLSDFLGVLARRYRADHTG
ncbi:hypothetical protein [Marihabitans asiaticum]|uniref:hypothetical protein n=1 Tax=Marihabitans asiaticum TaxID=415218 RepID=UPI00119E1E47|nr:hypothetical protein [Marihabitans asiaticum]